MGGPSQGIRNSIPALNILGCSNEVICFDSFNFVPRLHDNFPIHSIGKSYGIWGWNPQLKHWLSKHLCEFDVVIIHGLWQYHCYAVTRAIAKLKAKQHPNIPRVFVMPHGMLDPWFQTAQSRFWKAWRNWLYWKVIENYTVSQPDGLLFTCEQEMLLARKAFRPYSPKQEYHVGYGIAAPPIESTEMHSAFANTCPLLANRPYLLYLGRIHEKKAVDLLLEAYVRLGAVLDSNSQMPALVIAGPTVGVYARQIQERWEVMSATIGKDLQNGPDVFFPGMLQGDAKWGAIYGCDAIVLPSHQENFGIAIVEAMACRKPVLISNKINISLEIEKDGAGWIDSDTIEGISRLLKKWIASSETTRKELGRNAMQCYKNRYQADSAAKRLLDVIGVG